MRSSPRCLRVFQPTPSLRRATAAYGDTIMLYDDISTHALLAEGDRYSRPLARTRTHFNPRPPCGGRPATSSRPHPERLYFNPRPPCGGRHSLRITTRRGTHFNPRPPCGGRLAQRCFTLTTSLFQPTPSLRRATSSNPRSGARWCYFNPRPPCGGRLRMHRIPTV